MQTAFPLGRLLSSGKGLYVATKTALGIII